MSGPGRGSVPPNVNLCRNGAVLAATSVAPGVEWQDSCLLLEHEVERHGSDIIERPVCRCCGEALGVEIIKLSVVAGSDRAVDATTCVARPSGPRTLGTPFGELTYDEVWLPWGPS